MDTEEDDQQATQSLEELEKETNEADEKREENEGNGELGYTPQDDNMEDESAAKDDTRPQSAAEIQGQTSHDTQAVEQSETAKDQAGQSENNEEEREGTGTATSEQQEGHQGESSSTVSAGRAPTERQKQYKRRPGHVDTDRSLGSIDQMYKRLKTVDTTDNTEEPDSGEQREADMYEHVKDAKSTHDAQTLDVATADQQDQQPVAGMEEDQAEAMDVEDSVQPQEQDIKEEDSVLEKAAGVLKPRKLDDEMARTESEEMLSDIRHEISGDAIATASVARGPESSTHTAVEFLYQATDGTEVDVEKLRAELEEQLTSWTQPHRCDPENEALAADAWHKYEALTASLAQDLCEQLRLVLEPSQASKLRGDYRTGKRLNMRKVIPYIASQFRKDKIWLRRTKPSKRQYQIMLAIDDSSSMVDNQSKQLAFESLAVIANALTLLESGDLGVCSFGEDVKLLHPFSEPFTTSSGAYLLQHFTFEQKKTKIALLLQQLTSVMIDARYRQQGGHGSPETSQLVVVVSDGRGLFMEGMETVKAAVRQAQQANIFLVFVILDNPLNKDSILDIKVPVFKSSGQMPEIKSYMDHFPFPFYIILRDLQSLPQVLSDSLRQWFELVTAGDR